MCMCLCVCVCVCVSWFREITAIQDRRDRRSEERTRDEGRGRKRQWQRAAADIRQEQKLTVLLVPDLNALAPARLPTTGTAAGGAGATAPDDDDAAAAFSLPFLRSDSASVSRGMPLRTPCLYCIPTAQNKQPQKNGKPKNLCFKFLLRLGLGRHR